MPVFRKLKVWIAALSWSSASHFAPALLALLAAGFMIVRMDLDEQRRFEENQQAETSLALGRLADDLRANIDGDMNLARGLVAAIESDPDIDQAHFQQFGESLMKTKSQIRNFAGAPDLIVSLVYPLKPNVKSLGLNYRANPEQRASALEAQRSRRPLLTGPVNLVQGGQGLIARYPVFTRSPDGGERFWGLLSAVMDLDALYADSGLLASDLDIDVAIGRNGGNRESGTFFGAPALFGAAPIVVDVDLGYDTWKLAATPKGGWKRARPGRLASRLASFAIMLCIVGPFLWIGRLQLQRKASFAALRKHEDELLALSKRTQLALDASKIGVWEFDVSTGVLNWDARMRALYSVDPHQARCTYEDWRLALHPDDLAEAEKVFAESIAGETNYVTHFRVVTPAGEVRHIKAFGLNYRTAAGAKRIVGANWDVTDDVAMQEQIRAAHAQAEVQNRRLEEASQRLQHQSLHDALTGLPNRRYMDQYIESPETDKRHVLLHVDLDRFKEINDSLGHAAGDAVLQAAASRLLAVLEAGEFAARIGGDEFVVIAATETPDERAHALAKALHDTLLRPILVDSFECRVGASLGVATQTSADADIRHLLANADLALYRAKELGRNRVEFFSEALRLSAVSLRNTANDLLIAIERDEIVPFFQPQFDATTLEIVGVEALARWRHPTRGVLTPDQFLAVAEDLNRVHEIDAAILAKALIERARWIAAGVDVRKLSVNISAQRLRDERLMQQMAELAAPPGSLAFELLESISFDDSDDDFVSRIDEIKRFGVEIEIDDFGTGHASITSLLELAPTRLKINRKLIAPIVESDHHRRLVSSMIEIGKALGIEVIAEGVETMAQARILGDLGCNALQGYAFARPMSGQAFYDFLCAQAATKPVLALLRA